MTRFDPIGSLAGWGGHVACAATLAVRRHDLWPVALAGFLVRGGIVPLLLPILVLPTTIQIAGIILVDVVSITGQLTTEALFAAVVFAGVVLIWLFAAGAFGAAVDASLLEAGRDAGVGRVHGDAAAAERPAAAEKPAAGEKPAAAERPAAAAPAAAPATHPVDIGEQLAVRGFFLIPLIAVLATAALVVEQTAYAELTTPSTLETELVLRVTARTMPALVAVAVVWLLAEALGAIAIRYQLRDGLVAPAALLATLRHIVRRPLATVLTIVAALVVSIVVIGVPLYVANAAFDWTRVAIRSDTIAVAIRPPAGVPLPSTTRDVRPLLIVLAAGSLAVAWLVALVAAAIASLWRSFLFTALVQEGMAHAGAGEPVPEELPSLGPS